MGQDLPDEVIILHQGEIPLEIAKQFTSKHGLGERAAEILESQILTALSQQQHNESDRAMASNQKQADEDLSDASENIPDDDSLSEDGLSRD